MSVLVLRRLYYARRSISTLVLSARYAATSGPRAYGTSAPLPTAHPPPSSPLTPSPRSPPPLRSASAAGRMTLQPRLFRAKGRRLFRTMRAQQLVGTVTSSVMPQSA
eukprot:3859088-Rhodomonas_salina.2